MSDKKASLLIALIFAVGFSSLLFATHKSNPPSHAATASYHVVGNQILDPSGKAYAPYGFIFECLAYKDPYGSCNKASESDTDKIKATAGFWHGNTVRLQVAPENLLDQSPYDSKFMSLMDGEVNLANNLGLVVILSQQEEEYGGPIFNTQKSITFWKVMADHYKNSPKVFFDLYNEPAINPTNIGSSSAMWNVWQNGGNGTDGTAYVGYQTLINTIRGEGANNILVAEAPKTDSDLSGVPSHLLTGGNIAYGVETNLQSFSRTTSDWYNEWGQYKKQFPVMPEAFRDNVGRTCDPNSPADVPALLNYMHSIGMGSLYWTLESGIATTSANLTTPTTYNGHTTISCPASLADINPNNTVGPGADLLAFFTEYDTQGGPSPNPTVSLTAPASGATVGGSTVSVAATAAVSSGSISKIVLKAAGSTLKSCASASCNATWDTTSLTNGTYTLEADTVASDGNTNATTETVTVKNAQPVSISAPTNLSSPSQTTKSITVAWNASTDSKYPSSQLTYSLLRNGASVGTTAAGITTDIDNNLASGTYYSYALTAKDPAGNQSDPSASLAVKTKTPACAKPAAPQGVTATATSPTVVRISWKAVANPSSSCVITGYLISRNQAPLAEGPATSFTDSTATPNTSYEYNVLAIEMGNIAGPSASAHVTTPPSQTPDPGPTAPTNLQATAISDTQINLSWGASSDPVTGIKQYQIFRNGSQIGTATSTSFGDSGLSAHTQYTYDVIAVSGGDKTTSSSSVNVTTLNSPTPSGGGTGSGSNSGSSSTSSAASLPPVLQGTTSVGSGSDTGQDTSQNPTDTSSTTANVLGATTSNTPPSNKSLATRNVAYVGGSVLGVLALAGVGYLWMLRRKRFIPLFSSLNDPDFASQVVVGDDEHKPQGGQPS